MEEYLKHMRTLRSQMNDVEDQAAKISVEEQMQITTIQAMEKDLQSVKSETKQLKEDTEHRTKAKNQICSQILEKQRKIASLESDSSTLTQTLELIQQEKVSLSAKLIEKRNYYTKVAEDVNTKLQQQQEWVNSHKLGSELGEHRSVKKMTDDATNLIEGKSDSDNHLNMDNLENEARKNLTVKLDSAKSKLDEIIQAKSRLVIENSKVMQSIEKVTCRENDFKPELRAMNIKTLEEEYKALLSDKAGETEYLQSLQDQIEKLRGISHMVKCACGEEYEVKVDVRMQQT